MADVSGVGVLIISPGGDVVGQGFAFEREAPGGFSVEEAQEANARARGWRSAVEKLTADELHQCLTTYLVEELGEAMRRKGYRENVVFVGE